VLLAALVILFEDYVWVRITALVAWFARWRLVQRLEGWVLRRGRHTTLALFAVPIACLIPVKLTAVYLIATGHIVTGILVIVVAKVTGTAVAARLFVIARPKLMTFETFVTVYVKALAFKAWAHDVLEKLQVRETIRRLKARLGARSQTPDAAAPVAAPGFRHAMVQRLLAARRWLRRTG
jgi:hypothetical protein